MKELYEASLLSIAEKPVNIVWHPNSEKVAVIMDPRYDKLMVGVIKNFMQHLNPCGWNLVIITHEKYANLLEFQGCKLIHINEKRIHYKNGEPNIDIDTYNGILMSKEFWDFVPGEHILVFQKDCYMYKMFDEPLYLTYAFCGANCIWLSEDNTTYGLAINGGCSLRKKSEMLDCLQKVSWANIDKHFPKMKLRNEDLFFSFACKLLGKLLPKKEETHLFAVENEAAINPCFYHGWNKGYQTEEEAKRLINEFTSINEIF
jgi:hypothetical protein